MVRILSQSRVRTFSPQKRVPLTLIDLHLRHEQLPFGFFFREKLRVEDLTKSLTKILSRNFGVVGGRICYQGGQSVAIQCHENDYVSLSHAVSDKSMDYWLKQQHSYNEGGGHPTLLPLFEPLFAPGSHDDAPSTPSSSVVEDDDALKSDDDHDKSSNDDNDNKNILNNNSLATFRITHLSCGGTAIGVNFNHAVCDAASCFEFVKCWGLEMRRMEYPKVSNNRSRATCAGMATKEATDWMALGVEQHNSNQGESANLFLSTVLDVMSSVLGLSSQEQGQEQLQTSTATETSDKSKDSPTEGHEYIVLNFEPELIHAMKKHGMQQQARSDSFGDSFVSTNDMLSAYSWLLKRHLSDNQKDWCLSMVVDLRGRGGVARFRDNEKGVFGNALTNIFCSMAKTSKGIDSLTMKAISHAAASIRESLTKSIPNISDRVASSRLGTPMPHGNEGRSSFSTTSWSRFPFWRLIRFSETSKLHGFHGHPSYPLPIGQSFSSVITPNQNGGFSCNLLLPRGKAEQARLLHQQVSADFLEWGESQSA